SAAHESLCSIHRRILAAVRKRVNTNLVEEVGSLTRQSANHLRNEIGLDRYSANLAEEDRQRGAGHNRRLRTSMPQPSVCNFHYFFLASHLPVICPEKSKSPVSLPSLTM